MLSMIHMSQMTTVARRWGPYASKPQCVVDYNIGMKGVDLGDQLSSSYPSIRRSLKWYNSIYLFTYLTFPLWTVTPSLNIWETGLPKSPFYCGLVMQSSMSIGQLWSHTAPAVGQQCFLRLPGYREEPAMLCGKHQTGVIAGVSCATGCEKGGADNVSGMRRLLMHLRVFCRISLPEEWTASGKFRVHSAN